MCVCVCVRERERERERAKLPRPTGLLLEFTLECCSTIEMPQEIMFNVQSAVLSLFRCQLHHYNQNSDLGFSWKYGRIFLSCVMCVELCEVDSSDDTCCTSVDSGKSILVTFDYQHARALCASERIT